MMAKQAPDRGEQVRTAVLLGGALLIFAVALVVVAYAATAAVEGRDIGAALWDALAALWRVTVAVAQIGVAVAVVLLFLPAFLARFDKGIVERDARIADLREEISQLMATIRQTDSDLEMERTARRTAEARLESAGALINELRANAAGWEESARHAANERDKAERSLERAEDHIARALAIATRLLTKLRDARCERDAARSALAAVEGARSAKATLPGVVAFLRELKALEKRSERAVPPLFRAHVGPAANSPTTFAAVRELFALLDGEVGEGGEAERMTVEDAEHVTRNAGQGGEQCQ